MCGVQNEIVNAGRRRVLGAGVFTGGDWGVGTSTVEGETMKIMAAPYTPGVTFTLGAESSYPVGSVAYLGVPYEVDRGLNANPVWVQHFVKKKNGNWVSSPGGDAYFTSLAKLASKAQIQYVDRPASGEKSSGANEPTSPPVMDAPRIESGGGGVDAGDVPDAGGNQSAVKAIALGIGGIVGTAALGFLTWWGLKKVLK